MTRSTGAVGRWRRPGWARPLPPLLADGLLALGLGLLSVSSALGDRGRGANVPTLGLVLLAALVPALYSSRRVRLIAAACAGVALIVLALPVSSGWDRGNSLALLVAGAGAWLVGDVMRNRKSVVADLAERTARLERERDLEAARAAAEERLRIARELHDVVAHNLSVVVVQAQAAQRILDRDLERARGVVVSIERTGREALDEMRRLLGVLRAGEPSGGGEAEGDGLFGPQPGLARLGELVGQLHAAGLPVSLRVEGDERPLEAAVDLSAFRIVQEALTNALKHAGPARAEVVLRYHPRDLELTVSDDGRGGSARLDGRPVPGSGHGLVGMRERVELFGGELAAGPRPGGGYQVRARLPLEDTPA